MMEVMVPLALLEVVEALEVLEVVVLLELVELVKNLQIFKWQGLRLVGMVAVVVEVTLIVEQGRQEVKEVVGLEALSFQVKATE